MSAVTGASSYIQDTVKSVDPFDVYERFTGLPRPKVSGKGGSALCPFHQDNDPSLVIHPGDGHFVCRSCGESGQDIVRFVAKLLGISDIEAARTIRGEAEETPKLRRKESTPEPEVRDKTKLVPLDYGAVIEAYEQGREWAIEYLTSRGLSAEIVDDMMIGSELFRTKYGERLGVPGVHRLTIPHIVGGNVYNVKCRLDTAGAQAAWDALSEDIKAKVRRRVVRKKPRKYPTPESVDDEAAQAQLWGTRYMAWPGSKDVVFGMQSMVTFDDDFNYTLMPVSYVIVSEGEIDAMTLIDLLPDAGARGIAAKDTSIISLKAATSKAAKVYILADRDEVKTRPDGTTYRPGDEQAAALRSTIGRGRVIYPPEPYKDVNEFYVAKGAQAVINWLKSCGIYLVRREMLTSPTHAIASKEAA